MSENIAEQNERCLHSPEPIGDGRVCEWRETARELPKDGETVLAWVTWPGGQGRDSHQLAWYTEATGFDWNYYKTGWAITHWTPLPEPPAPAA